MAAEKIMRQVDIDAKTGKVVYEAEWLEPATPLNTLGVLATLLAVSGVVSVEDAANAVNLEVDDLVTEAQSWAVASQEQPSN